MPTDRVLSKLEMVAWVFVTSIKVFCKIINLETLTVEARGMLVKITRILNFMPCELIQMEFLLLFCHNQKKKGKNVSLTFYDILVL